MLRNPNFILPKSPFLAEIEGGFWEPPRGILSFWDPVESRVNILLLDSQHPTQKLFIAMFTSKDREHWTLNVLHKPFDFFTIFLISCMAACNLYVCITKYGVFFYWDWSLMRDHPKCWAWHPSATAGHWTCVTAPVVDMWPPVTTSSKRSLCHKTP